MFVLVRSEIVCAWMFAVPVSGFEMKVIVFDRIPICWRKLGRNKICP